jgi:hypothetical protein
MRWSNGKCVASGVDGQYYLDAEEVLDLEAHCRMQLAFVKFQIHASSQVKPRLVGRLEILLECVLPRGKTVRYGLRCPDSPFIRAALLYARLPIIYWLYDRLKQ